MKKILWSCLVVAVVLAGCSKDKEEKKKLTVDPTSITLNATKAQQLTASEKNVTWQTASAFVAEVSASGTVTGKHVGKTMIMASDGSSDAQCAVEVTPVYKTFKEPVLDFGASQADVKSKETRTLAQTTSTSLVYTGEKNSITGVVYMF